jgi:S-(hydroxymethyl)glutathione dehydrogenase/alcohol dehydrogenase
MRAAVMWATRAPLTIEEVTTSSLMPNEVRVATRAVGLCHSDLHVLDGHISRPLPTVLGHEAAGVVTEVGAGVTGVEVGAHVVACLVVHCGTCRWCRRGQPTLCGNKAATNRGPGEPRRLTLGDALLHPFTNIGGLAEEMVLHRSAVTVVPPTVPFDVAALLGCAVCTGVGVVDNVARVRAGDVVAVIGCGGVGLNIVQAARAAGAAQVFAIDLDERRRRDAVARFGATEALDAADSSVVVGRVLAASEAGADHVFDAVGRVATTALALDLAAAGAAVYGVGVYPEHESIPLAVGHLQAAKRVVGVRMGDITPAIDIPRLVDRYLGGELLLDQLISDRVGLDDVNAAFDSLRNTDGLRTVVTFEEGP